MQALLCFRFVKTTTRQNNLFSVGDVTSQNRHNPYQTRCKMINRHHVKIVIDLQIRIFKEIIQNQLGIGILFQLNSNTKPVTVRLIPHFCNASYLIIDPNVINLLDQNSFVNVIRNFSDNNLLFAAFELFNLRPRTHDNAPLSSLIGFLNLISPLHNSSRWKVRARQKLHEFVNLSFGVVNHIDHRIDDFCQIVRRNVRRISSRNPCRPIHQKIGKSSRQYGWFFLRIVKVPSKRHGALFNVLEQVARNLRQTSFGIPHSGWRIAVHRTVISVHFH